ncbi:FKBP-type peptidyl-prolyl cis-trans isomerase [Lacibacter sp. H407]|uniref:FKBP-type peptidyl-prolyl cis-trans isomerase n=1 Tax=Lacibacter sp. H407 TaxID=3133423 RepID=UPI0030C3938C
MKYLLSLLSVVVLLSACKKKDEGCDAKPGNTSASAQEEAMVTEYIAANNITGAVELGSSGLYYVIETPGNSKKPGLCTTVAVKYVGRLTNGTIFDQTTGTNTAVFSLANLIESWQRTIPLLGEGGKIKLIVPPALGYGAAGSYNSNTGQYTIPPNSVLLFDIELVTVAS